MGFGKVNNIDIIANAGTVGSVIVVAEHCQLRTQPCGSLCQERHQILRHPVGQLAYVSRRVSAYGVEIAQQDALERSARCYHILNNFFRNLLRGPVRRCGMLYRSRFVYRVLVRLAVNGA